MLGLLYDIHGNLPALDAVLEDARATGVERWVIGGDVALMGAWPAEVVARLAGLGDARWLRGNADRWLTDDSDRPEVLAAAAHACRDALGDETVRRLVGLPNELRDGETLFVHASPLSDMRSFLPDPVPDEDELLDAAPAGVRRFVFGHTHLPFRRQARGIELVNPGSVGTPLDGDHRAAWAVSGDDGTVEHRRVGYDHEASAAALTERFGAAPWTEVAAARLRTARIDAS